jgi:hypothetical protein
MSNLDEVLKDLRQDIELELKESRIDRAREERAARIQAAFLAAGIAPVAKTADSRTLQFEEMLAEAVGPEVEVCGLQVQAEELCAAIGRLPVSPHRRRFDGGTHQINEVFQGRIEDLYREAEASLGFGKSKR